MKKSSSNLSLFNLFLSYLAIILDYCAPIEWVKYFVKLMCTYILVLDFIQAFKIYFKVPEFNFFGSSEVVHSSSFTICSKSFTNSNTLAGRVLRDFYSYDQDFKKMFGQEELQKMFRQINNLNNSNFEQEFIKTLFVTSLKNSDVCNKRHDFRRLNKLLDRPVMEQLTKINSFDIPRDLDCDVNTLYEMFLEKYSPPTNIFNIII